MYETVQYDVQDYVKHNDNLPAKILRQIEYAVGTYEGFCNDDDEEVRDTSQELVELIKHRLSS